MNKIIICILLEDGEVFCIDNQHQYNDEEQDVYDYKWILMRNEYSFGIWDLDPFFYSWLPGWKRILNVLFNVTLFFTFLLTG